MINRCQNINKKELQLQFLFNYLFYILYKKAKQKVIIDNLDVDVNLEVNSKSWIRKNKCKYSYYLDLNM